MKCIFISNNLQERGEKFRGMKGSRWTRLRIIPASGMYHRKHFRLGFSNRGTRRSSQAKTECGTAANSEKEREQKQKKKDEEKHTKKAGTKKKDEGSGRRRKYLKSSFYPGERIPHPSVTSHPLCIVHIQRQRQAVARNGKSMTFHKRMVESGPEIK